MPGGRLTHEDRCLIAGWLADGLGYAEIGRRLGRPTSTISREAARNSAPGGYLADHAQGAADLRARRSGPARPVRPGPAADERLSGDGSSPGGGPSPGEGWSSGGGRWSGEVRAFVDRFAGLLAATGLPRMTSRVFVSLVTADADGLTAADLVRRLQVSPASVSKSIGSLEAMELVVRRSDPGRRRERYLIDDDVWLRAWQADTGAHGEIATAALRGAELFGADTTAGGRLDRMGRFFARLRDQMRDSTLADAVAYDVLTVLAALVHSGRPLTLDAVAAALGWPRDRAVAALDALRRRPDLADPLALRTVGPGTYAVTARPDRLTPAQREALER
ncbi:MarR family transcriptional regulator [Streptomyces uncialis]|uniref:GbsR/MarR family transcriptional regulator n=1 Tax=Streptomyces uncialis TaxID=1048205 RepID=UPI0037BB4206